MTMRKKSDLLAKRYVTCSLPFTWRKKWESACSDVNYCSQRCRRGSNSGNAGELR